MRGDIGRKGRSMRAAFATLILLLAVAGGARAFTNGMPAGPPNDPVTGIGEPSLIVVIGGQFATEEEALEAAEGMSLGDVQGFYVDVSDNYRVLGSYARLTPDFVSARNERGEIERRIPPVALRYRGDGVGPALEPGRWMLLSAFRTLLGAEQFVDLVRAATGVTDPLILRVQKVAGGYVGLGQEPHPNGLGPLTGPLPNQERYQR